MISVIIPVWNGESWLRRCLDSVAGQTIFEEIEAIVIDDGSTDSSGAIADDYARRFSNVRVFHTPNRGVSAARNRGLEAARGQYLTFVDADDYLEPDMLERMRESIGSADIVKCGMLVEYPNQCVRRTSQRQSLDRERAIRAFLMGVDVEPNVAGKLFRASAVKGLRFDEGLCMAEDKEFLFRCLLRLERVEVMDFCGYHYVMNGDSACRRTFDRKKLDSLIVADRIAAAVGISFPHMKPLAKSMTMDVKCRVCGEICACGAEVEFGEQFGSLRREIRRYPAIEKWKHSTRKHFLAFLAARISPRLYVFLKRDLKLQYRG